MRKNKIIVIFSSHGNELENNKFIEHISTTVGVSHETHCYPNFNQYSLSSVYNKAIKEHHKDNSIMVFVHNDVVFETKKWGEKILRHFNNPSNDYQILGVAGSVEIPKHGCWYLKPDNSGLNMTSMRGIINHDNGVSKWTSEYSKSLKGVDPVVTVDGVLMAVDTTEIINNFDEDYGMWHYYDMGFCVPNYLDGCNIGVVYDVRITHKSIGITDEDWQRNRDKFADKNKNDLPLYYRPIDDKMSVLLVCLSFQNLTGSELYIYELAKELIKLDCNVSIFTANLGDPLYSKLKSKVNFFTPENPPNYVKTSDGRYEFRYSGYHFDIIHLNHKPIADLAVQLFPNTPAVMHVHSEIIPKFEEPIKSGNIKKYFSIRPTVREYIKSHGIKDDEIINVVNPIDKNRFYPSKKHKKNKKEIILFVGSIDYLRIKMLEDLAKEVKEKDKILQIIGSNTMGFLKDIKEIGGENVEYLGVRNDVEKYMRKCDYTAGILLGRTTLEGYMCGKKGIIYDVDQNGNILSKKITELSDTPVDIKEYYAENVAKKIHNIYVEIIDNDNSNT